LTMTYNISVASVLYLSVSIILNAVNNILDYIYIRISQGNINFYKMSNN
jgi:hypothetical protein